MAKLECTSGCSNATLLEVTRVVTISNIKQQQEEA